MPDPILRVRYPVERSALYINIAIRNIKAHVPDRRRLARQRALHAHAFEKRRRDQIHVLAWVGEKPHHRKCGKRAQRAAVVVAGESAVGVAELGGDVGVGTLCAEGGTAGVVVLEDGEEGGFVADVNETRVMEVVEAFDECGGAAEGGYQGSHVVGNEAGGMVLVLLPSPRIHMMGFPIGHLGQDKMWLRMSGNET